MDNKTLVETIKEFFDDIVLANITSNDDIRKDVRKNWKKIVARLEKLLKEKEEAKNSRATRNSESCVAEINATNKFGGYDDKTKVTQMTETEAGKK